MDPLISSRFSETILAQALDPYGVTRGEVEELKGFESFIYLCQPSHRDSFVLRLSHSLRRSRETIAGEVDWINHLVTGGVPCAAAIPSQRGELVEAIPDGAGGEFLATAFKEAPGARLPKTDWSDEFRFHYGEVLGRMHSVTKDYSPSRAAVRRPHWHEAIASEMVKCEPYVKPEVMHRFESLLDYLQRLPKDVESYGMIHQDAHSGNFFVHEGKITLFDFDDCVSGHFIYDLAMVLFYAVTFEDDPEGFTASFFPKFLEGYRSTNSLEPFWLRELPHFMKLREIDLFTQIHYRFDVAQNDDPWIADYLEGREERILDNVPLVEYDWDSLA